MISPAELEAASQGRPHVRLQAFREILNRPGGVAQRLPDLAPQFPFRLGEGPRDWVIPYTLDDRIVAVGTQAIEELFDALADRRQAGIEPSVPPRYGLRRGIQPWGMRLAREASELDPLLDAALVEAWGDRSAGALGEALYGAFTRALEAELLADKAPPYGCLMALASITFAATLKERIKSRTIRGLAYERLEKALGLGLFALIEVSAGRAIQEIERRPRPRDARPAIDRVRLCLNPLSYCSIRTRALQNGLNPWWLPDDLSELWLARRADELLSRPIDQLLQVGLDQVLQDVKLRSRYAQAGRRARFRHELLRVLWEYDRGSDEPWGEIRGALAVEERLDALQEDSRTLIQRLRQAGVSQKALAPVQRVFLAGNDLEDLQLAVSNQIVYGLDRQVATQVDRLTHQLRDARAEGETHALKDLYDQGRLYRLSASQDPILQVAKQRLSGHLFVDLKGFTQRTVRAKEIVVADFLRREFYEPILQAAGALSGEGREVKLLNLIGDAAVFAGEVPLLIRLATDIRRICTTYQRTLAGVDPDAAANELERERREIESRLTAIQEPLRQELAQLDAELTRKRTLTLEQLEFELRRLLQSRASELARAHHETREKLGAATQTVEREAIEARMLRLSEAQEALAASARSTFETLAPQAPPQRMETILDLITGREKARSEELGRALQQTRDEVAQEVSGRGQARRAGQDNGLEAGVFVSYGAAPEEIRIEDPVFGEVKVAVAEKLNEAARGTGRSSKVAEEVADALRRAMSRTGNQQLRQLFSVHVGARNGEVATEIFNVGEAISAEALQVFLQRAAGQRYHFEKLVRRTDLAPEISKRFAIPDRFRLIVSLSSNGSLSDALLFREVGLVLFRGFEGGEGCEVYEILSAGHRLTRLLAQHHLQRWADEAKANPKLLLSGLPGR